MARLTPLEAAVLDALAWELRWAVPDLAGQVEESWPGQRRNTGFGYFAELIVDRNRPPPALKPHGRFGTVHAMVGDLPEPVAFQVELREGRLLALHADSYGQDTRAVDFATTPFDEVFTVDDAGESVLFDARAVMPESPLLDLQAHGDALPEEPLPAPRESPLRVLQRSDEKPHAATTAPADPLEALLNGSAPSSKGKLIAWLITGGLILLGAYLTVGGEPNLFTLAPLVIGGCLFRFAKLRMALARRLDIWLEPANGPAPSHRP